MARTRKAAGKAGGKTSAKKTPKGRGGSKKTGGSKSAA